MLWEDSHYESGNATAARIVELVKTVSLDEAVKIAIEARELFKLRHAPLFLTREILRHHKGSKVGDLIARVIQRPDEMGELFALYRKDGKNEPAQLKIGVARAFKKFSEYQLAKYNREGAFTLRDIFFMCHPRPKDDAQKALFDRVVNKQLATPDTWEVALSEGADKKATFARLITENKLGALALLRNLRNMVQSGVDPAVIRDGLARMKGDRVLPFRFIAAAKAAPQYETEIDQAMLRSLNQRPKLLGKTLIVIDVSGSMYGSPVSKKSDMDRAVAACALGAIARELCADPRIYATAGSDARRIHQTQMVPVRRGMALVDAIHNLRMPLGGGGIFLKQVMDFLLIQEKTADRVIVITDEQDCGIAEDDRPSKANAFGTENYLINVATYANGINFGQWTQINGFSEAVFDFILANEAAQSN
jgi:hypothetical protein